MGRPLIQLISFVILFISGAYAPWSQADTAIRCQAVFQIDIQLPTLEMQSRYRGEDIGSYIDPVTHAPWQVKYFTETEKQAFQLYVNQGRLVNNKGEAVSSPFDAESLNFESGLLVIDRKQRIFLLPFEERGKFHHSSLSAGEPVLFAGTMALMDGRVREISNQSGHYKPSAEQTVKILRWLQDKGVYLQEAKLSGTAAKELNNSFVVPIKQIQHLVDP